MKLQKRLDTTTLYVTHDQVEAMTMGDRIAVMSKGVLQQIGTAQALYTNPANAFVAQFIGSPSMNVLPSGAIGLDRDGLLAGFRPEHILVGNGRADAASYDALVEVVEYLGDEQLAHLRLGDLPVVAKVPVEQRLETGATLTFSVPLRQILLFDAASGEAAGRAA